jgi:hypothetical protein
MNLLLLSIIVSALSIPDLAAELERGSLVNIYY